MPENPAVHVRPVAPSDLAAWTPLWDGYNAFYGRVGPTALRPEVTQVTWQRLLDRDEPIHALVAELDESIMGFCHYLFHRSSNRIEPVCYLQDLFTDPATRGQGIGRALIEGVYAAARAAGVHRVYWTTHESNAAGRKLYDRMARHAGFLVYSHEV